MSYQLITTPQDTLGQIQVDIKDAEHATILAALRFYQECEQGEPDNRTDAIHEIATKGETVISLNADAIDYLCEKINF